MAVPASDVDPLIVAGLFAHSNALLDASLDTGLDVRSYAFSALAARDHPGGVASGGEPGTDTAPADPDAAGGPLPGPDGSLPDAAGIAAGGDAVPLAGAPRDDGPGDDLFRAGARRVVRVARTGGITIVQPFPQWKTPGWEHLWEAAGLDPDAEPAEDGDPDDESGVWDDGNGREG